jgi:hypothetical protein
VNHAKRLGQYVRGFARATNLAPKDLGAVYLLLAVEQLELAAKPEPLTFELWQAASAAAWKRVQEEKQPVRG